jgi:limonene-1,2-epoxide hydrolase
MSDDNDLIDLVEAFQEALNQHDVDKVMSMFAENAEFEIVGVSKYSGKQQIRNVFEYDVGVNTELKFINCKTEGNTVRCQALERNDRLAAIGIDELKYTSSNFVFSDRRIQSFISEIPPGVVQHNREVWQKFIPWLSKNYPDEHSKMFTSEGRFIYNHANGRGVVALLKKWREVNDR